MTPHIRSAPSNRVIRNRDSINHKDDLLIRTPKSRLNFGFIVLLPYGAKSV